MQYLTKLLIAASLVGGCKARQPASEVRATEGQAASLTDLLGRLDSDLGKLEQAPAAAGGEIAVTQTNDIPQVARTTEPSQAAQPGAPESAFALQGSVEEDARAEVLRLASEFERLLESATQADREAISNASLNLRTLAELLGPGLDGNTQKRVDAMIARAKAFLAEPVPVVLSCGRSPRAKDPAPYLPQRPDGALIGFLSGNDWGQTLEQCKRSIKTRKGNIVCSSWNGTEPTAGIFRISDGKQLGGNQLGYSFDGRELDLCHGAVQDSANGKVCAFAGTSNVYLYDIASGSRISETFGKDYARCVAVMNGKPDRRPATCTRYKNDNKGYAVTSLSGSRIGPLNGNDTGTTLEECEESLNLMRNGLFCGSWGTATGVFRLTDGVQVGGNGFGIGFVDDGSFAQCQRAIYGATTEKICAKNGSKATFVYKIADPENFSNPDYGTNMDACLKALWEY